MKFVVNLAFWEMLKKQHSPLTEKVQPTVDFVEQTFDIRLFDDNKDPLNKATDLLHMINKMGEHGKKHERKHRELEDTLGDGKQKPLLPKFLANIMIVVYLVLSTMVSIAIILVLIKYCKMSSTVASLVVGSQLPPPMPAALQLPWLAENMYLTCLTLVTGFRSSDMNNRLFHKLSHGLGTAIVGCEKFMTFFNDLCNDWSDPYLGSSHASAKAY